MPHILCFSSSHRFSPHDAVYISRSNPLVISAVWPQNERYSPISGDTNEIPWLCMVWHEGNVALGRDGEGTKNAASNGVVIEVFWFPLGWDIGTGGAVPGDLLLLLDIEGIF